jgi:anti-anti-sigma factor
MATGKRELHMDIPSTPTKDIDTFTLAERDGVVVLELHGEFGSLRWPARDERSILATIERTWHPRVVVDLSDATYGGSHFLAFLVDLKRRVLARGGRVALAGTKGNLLHVLNVVQFDRVLCSYDTADDAIAGLNERDGCEASLSRPD